MSTDRKVQEKGSVEWRPPAPTRICCIFSCKPRLTAHEFSESATEKYYDVDFRSGGFFQFFHTHLVLNNLRRNSEVNKWQDALAEALRGAQLKTSSDNGSFFFLI